MNKPTLKVLFVFNNNDWSTIPQKLQEIRDFYSSKVDLLVSTVHTKFTNIPFETVATLDGTGHQDGTDVAGHSETVLDSWLDSNIVVPMAKGFDIVLFCISDVDKVGHITASGIRTDRDQGPVEIIMFGGNENYRTYVNGIDIGNSFSVFSAHEIAHAIYMILGKKDNTHLFFYSGHPEKVLEDFIFPTPNDVDSISAVRQLLVTAIGLANQLLAILLNKQKEMETQNPPVGVPVNKIDKFCKAIQTHEGYFTPCAQYPKGSRSYKNNNPGNLKYAGQTGSTGKDSGGFAIFPDYETGFKALKRQVEIGCLGKSKVYFPTDTILQFFEKFAPYSDNNDPRRYASFVAQEVGVLPTTKLKELL